MPDFFARLFDPSEFVPRENARGWTRELSWLHNGSDILTSLALFALALAMVYGYFRLREGSAVRQFVVLLIGFCVAAGSAHLLEAIASYVPIYRLTGLMKAVTAAVAWLAVVVLVPSLPRLVARLGSARRTTAPDADDRPRFRQYVVAVLIAVVTVLVRVLLEPLLGGDFPFILAFLAVVASAWYGGLWPALLCLLLSYVGASSFILSPGQPAAIPGLSQQLGTGLFVFAAVGCAFLGEAQRRARLAAERSYRSSLAQRVELETEVERRKKIEDDLRVQAGDLAIAQRRTADTLALLDTFVHNTPVGLALFDPELRYVLVNQYLADVNRRPAEEHIGRPLAEAVPDLPPSVEGDLRAVLETGQPVVHEQLRIDRPSGEVYRAGYYPVRSADGGLIGVGAVIEDVTEKVRSDAALKASERRFRELAESLPQLVWTCRADGSCDYLSRQWEAYTGRPAGEQLGSAWAEAVHPDDRGPTTTKWQAAVAAGNVFETEFRVRRHDGAYRWFYTRAVPVYDATGAVEQWYGTNTDIHARKEAEEAVREREADLNDFFENGPVGLHLIGPDGSILRANRAELELLGYVAAEYVGRPARDFYADPADPADADDVLARLLRGETVENHEVRLRANDGTPRDVLLSASGLWKDGRFVHARCFTRDVTDRKRAVDELRASEARKAAVLESALDAIITIDRHGRVVEFNPAAERTFGYAREAAVGRDMGDLIVPPGLRGAHRQGMARYLETGVGVVLNRRLELAAVRADGTEFPVEVAITATASGGEPLFTGHIRDITARKQVEDALRESEARFRTLADSAPIMVWEADPAGRFTYFNKAWLDFTGLTLKNKLRLGWAEGVHPDDLDRGLETYEAHLASQTPYELEYRRLRRDGEYRWLLARGTPRFTPGGEFVGFLGACVDITDRRRAEEEMRESNRRLQQLADAMPQIVWAARPDGRVDYFNERWYEFTGSPHDGDGAPGWDAILHPEDRQPALDSWYTAVQTGLPYEAEYRVRDRGGGYRWFLGKALPARDENGRLVRWFGSSTDIHVRKTQEETLERLVGERTAELKRSNEELEKFAYVASHDLQEPLRKVQAFGDLLRTKQREALGAEGRDYLDRMTASAGRMRQLIQDLLEYSRVATKGQPFTPVDLDQVADDVLSDLSVRIEQTRGRVDVGPLPTIDADPTQMRQLFQNLIGNALKFHKPDVPPEVVVRGDISAAEPDVCRISFADNGIGFDEKYTERIFQVFQRLHGRGEYEGTGVGLALCRKIAERHGGEITVRSAPGAGSTFTVTLPVRRTNP